jgi:hypothetical protein
MDADERSIDDLIEVAEGMSEASAVSAGMDAIRATAHGEGISLTVNMAGMLLELELDEAALSLGAERLAAEISRLTGEASTSALREGLRGIKARCGDRVATMIGAQLGIDDEPAPPAPVRPSRREITDDEEGGSFLVESWSAP